MSDPIDDAVAAALRGELIVIPTDTVYGIGTRPDVPGAADRLFEAKGRPRDLELPVLVASTSDAHRIAEFDPRAVRMAGRAWPGPLTLVLPRTNDSATWDLGGSGTTIGVRIPRHPLAQAVLARTGPLAVTSANRSGEPTPEGCDGVVDAFGDTVAVYLCEEKPLAGRPSAVVDLTHGEARILRTGALGVTELEALLAD